MHELLIRAQYGLSPEELERMASELPETRLVVRLRSARADGRYLGTAQTIQDRVTRGARYCDENGSWFDLPNDIRDVLVAA